MTVVDAVLAFVILVLLLVLLGLMREVMILRGDVRALSQLIAEPPTPPSVGKPAPPALRGRLTLAPGRHVVAFLSEGCGGCAALMSELAGRTDGFGPERRRVHLVVEASDGDAPLARNAARLGLDLVVDPEGTVREACRISATPSMLAIEVGGDGESVVNDYKLGGGVAWIHRVLTLPRQREATASS